MKKPFQLDKKYLHWGVTAFLVIVGSIVFFLLLSRLAVIWAAVKTIVSALSPIIYGLVFAYLLNKLMSFLESSFLARAGTRLYPNNPGKARGFSRLAGVILTLLIILIIVGGTLALVIPQIIVSLRHLVKQLPEYYRSIVKWSDTFLTANPDLESGIAKFFGNVTTGLTNWLQTTLLARTNQILSNVTTGVFSVIKELVSIVIGLIVSVYILSGKEKFSGQCKRLLFGSFKPRRANRILKSARFLDKTVGGFILGKLIESIIVGLISYIVLMIFGMPYPVLIAVFLAVTNVIPYFGVFIGAIPSALMILLESPLKGLIFVVYIIVIHTFATNVLAPRIQGETIGLGGFWVLFAILLFGGLFGFWGLLLGVPVFAVIYAAVASRNLTQLKEKNFPVTTAEYETILQIDPETGIPIYMPDDNMLKKDTGGKPDGTDDDNDENIHS